MGWTSCENASAAVEHGREQALDNRWPTEALAGSAAEGCGFGSDILSWGGQRRGICIEDIEGAREDRAGGSSHTTLATMTARLFIRPVEMSR